MPYFAPSDDRLSKIGKVIGDTFAAFIVFAVLTLAAHQVLLTFIRIMNW